MERIEQRQSNWLKPLRDCLGGIPLEDGEKLRVKFPDGIVLWCIVHLVKSEMQVAYDAPGSEGTQEISVYKAYVMTDFHSVNALVPLEGLQAERL